MQLKQMGIAIVAVGALSANAYANEAAIEQISAQPQKAFTETDLSALFEQDAKPMQLAALSDKEMKETEGAWVWNTVAWTAGGGALGTGLTSGLLRVHSGVGVVRAGRLGAVQRPDSTTP